MHVPIKIHVVLRAFPGAVVSAGAGLLLISMLSACHSYPANRPATMFERASPKLTVVRHGSAFRQAQQAVVADDGDFVLEGSGRSMAPFYPAGTAIVVRPVSYFMLRPGMSVVYVNGEGVCVAHVLIEKRERGWMAMGLNNPAPDDDLVTPENLVGMVRKAFIADLNAGFARSPGVVRADTFAALTW